MNDGSKSKGLCVDDAGLLTGRRCFWEAGRTRRHPGAIDRHWQCRPPLVHQKRNRSNGHRRVAGHPLLT